MSDVADVGDALFGRGGFATRLAWTGAVVSASCGSSRSADLATEPSRHHLIARLLSSVTMVLLDVVVVLVFWPPNSILPQVIVSPIRCASPCRVRRRCPDHGGDLADHGAASWPESEPSGAVEDAVDEAPAEGHRAGRRMTFLELLLTIVTVLNAVALYMHIHNGSNGHIR
jgi:hypothetical protein